MLQQGGRAEESLHTWLRWAACTLCWHCASQAWHPARGCGRAVLSRARSERRQLGQTRKEDGKGMGRQHRSQKSTPELQHAKHCTPCPEEAAAGHTDPPLGTGSPRDGLRSRGLVQEGLQPTPSQKQQAHLRELPVPKPLHPAHARHRLALGRGSVGNNDRWPPGETLDLPPDELPDSKFLPILKAKDNAQMSQEHKPTHASSQHPHEDALGCCGAEERLGTMQSCNSTRVELCKDAAGPQTPLNALRQPELGPTCQAAPAHGAATHSSVCSTVRGHPPSSAAPRAEQEPRQSKEQTQSWDSWCG